MATNENEHQPLVSVSIIAYNRRDMVGQSLDSVLAQTYPNIEVILCDDGSTDGTGEFVREHYGDRVTYIYQENQGPAAARNATIRAAQGKYIALQDDDDIWLPEKLEKQVPALEQNPDAALCYGICLAADPDGKETGEIHGQSNRGMSGDCFSLFLSRNVIMEPVTLVRASVFDEVGLFDEELPAGKDTDMFLRIALEHAAEYIAEPLMLVRQHPGRRTLNLKGRERALRARQMTMAKLVQGLPEDRRYLRPALARRLVKAHIELVRMQLEELDWDALGERLTDVYWATAHVPARGLVAQWTASLLREWGAKHPEEARERLAEESLATTVCRDRARQPGAREPATGVVVAVARSVATLPGGGAALSVGTD